MKWLTLLLVSLNGVIILNKSITIAWMLAMLVLIFLHLLHDQKWAIHSHQYSKSIYWICKKIDNAEDSEETISNEVNDTDDGELSNYISAVLSHTSSIQIHLLSSMPPNHCLPMISFISLHSNTSLIIIPGSKLPFVLIILLHFS